ncbi:TPA: hypothetical protein ACIQN5_002761 [Bacillus cereus]|uniref:hypothetical protein n=1 Tax=Bacillus cereus TaxID=1396 RepID=UPI0037C31598
MSNNELASKFETIMEKLNLMDKKIEQIELCVDDFELDSTGEKDCTEAFQNMLKNTDPNKTICFSKGGIYRFSKTIYLNPHQKIDFKYATILHDGDGILFDTNFKTHNPVYLRNAFIQMNKNHPTQIAFNLRKISGGYFNNILLENGAYGFYAEQSHTYELNKIYHKNPSKAGIYHDGDGGCEMTWHDIQIVFVGAFMGKYGIEISRTTTEDLGGYYWHNVLIVVNRPSGATAQQGIYVHGPIGEKAIIVLNLIGGGADGFDVEDAESGKYALKLENTANHRISQGWITSICLNNTDNSTISNLNNPYGLFLKNHNNAINVSLLQCGESTAFNFDENAKITNFHYSNIRTNGELTNQHRKLTEFADRHAKTIYTDPLNGDGALVIADSHNPQNRFHLRIDEFGQLIFLDQSFEKVILQVSQAGTIRLPNDANVLINNQKVLGERRPGWNNPPTGIANRNSWDSSTASLQDVASTLKALIDDLQEHGLI